MKNARDGYGTGNSENSEMDTVSEKEKRLVL